MGCGQSSLKKEIATLHALEKEREAEINKLQDERRMLKYKMAVLEEMVATAQLEAHEKIVQAADAEERMKVMKWELVRQSRPMTPRQRLTWELNEKTVQKLTKSPTAKDAAQAKATISAPTVVTTPADSAASTTTTAAVVKATIDPKPLQTQTLVQITETSPLTPLEMHDEVMPTKTQPTSRRRKDANAIERGDFVRSHSATSMQGNGDGHRANRGLLTRQRSDGHPPRGKKDVQTEVSKKGDFGETMPAASKTKDSIHEKALAKETKVDEEKDEPDSEDEPMNDVRAFEDDDVISIDDADELDMVK
ncbi:hypothetical protein AC1031_001216 [Aphanomyces cochlioides]|nr:hypothetical protein AC1031_001216 [Aphanomyces cochlioides]